ncbi:MAG: ATP-dependent Clp protease ATP-binding subunit [Patescibacteria group bacterium]
MNQEIYFNDPRFRMTVLGRLILRVASFAIYGTLAVSAILFIVGDVALKMAGILIALFLVDRFLNFKKGDRSLAKLPKGKINAAKFLSADSFRVLEWALDKAVWQKGNPNLHLLSRLVKKPEIANGLLRISIDLESFRKKTDELIESSPLRKYLKNELIKNIEDLSKAAFNQALARGGKYIEPQDLFSALSDLKDPDIDKLLRFFDVNKDDLNNALIFGKKAPSSFTGFIERHHKARHRVMNRAWTARPTPFLDQFSQDLTDLARLEKVGFLIGHASEYDRLVDILSRPARPNALLVGEPGIGKETLVAHLAFQIVKDRVPPPLFDKRLIKLDVSGLLAGAEEAELSKRIEKIINEIIMAGNVILYIPDVHSLLKKASVFLLPAIKGSAFSVLGATYPREFKDSIGSNTEIASAFETIQVQELSESEAAKFLVYDSILLEKKYGIMITFDAVKESVRLARRYFNQKPLPSSAEDLLKESLADAIEKKKKILKGEDVIETAQKRTNIPLRRAGKSETEQLLNLEELIHRRLVDQEEAVKKVAQALREYRSGLSRKGGPIANFLFVGPTGVGKTELAKILSEIQFGSQSAMARFDMSEFQEKSSVNRLLDNLTAAIKEKPYSLILLDEFEKAHGDILNLFLQVFDDGRLTDSAGKTADFQNTIIIATSNAHSDFIKSSIESGKDIKSISEELKSKLVNYFRPELLNRFSGIIVFKNLSRTDLRIITRIQLRDLANQLRETNSIDISFDDLAADKIMELGYDPVFGARPLRAVISEKIKGVLAEKILRKEIGRGSIIKVSYDGQTFRFSQ